jgi:broad specificity phosphatase PhoE
MKRMKSFLDELKTSHDGKTIMIIGHRATQFGLDYWINHTSLYELTTAHFVWQPGWKYQL